MRKLVFDSFVQEIIDWDSDTFFGGNLTRIEATAIAERLLYELVNNRLDGVQLSYYYHELFGE